MEANNESAAAQVPAEVVPTVTTSSQIWVYGSGECDQLGLVFGEDDVMEVKRARKIELFNCEDSVPQSITEKVPLSQVICGGMHTVVVTPNGIPYSWGCNDDGALGRQGNDSIPERVHLPNPVDGIAVGGSHSVFYNTELSNAFFCGLYRNAVAGRVTDPIKEPIEIGQKIFLKGKRRLTKIVSGLDHNVALTTDGKVWAWGDAESGKIGRLQKSRRTKTNHMEIAQVGAKKAADVFCGGHASFYKNEKGQLFAWGLNNHGQLGIGYKENVCAPKLVIWPEEPENATQVAGGEHHTIALTESGRVYCWGRNDEGECGVGDLFGKYRREEAARKAQEELDAAEAAAAAAIKAQEEAEAAPVNGEEAKDQAIAEEGKPAEEENKKPSRSSKKSSKKSKEQEEPDLVGIYYFSIPNRVPSLDGKAISQVSACGHYNYAVARENNEVYAWGMGENYVLGTRDDENEYEPKLVHPKQFMENRVVQVGTGVQHTVILTTASTEASSAISQIDRSKLTEKLDMPKKEEPVVVEESKELNGQAAENGQHDNGVPPEAEKLLQEKEDAPREELKVTSQKMSQASAASKKRTADQLKVGQQALEPVGEKVAEGEEDEKRTKEQ